MNDVLVKNSDIDHRVSRYRRIYEQFRYISFEMTEYEYNALSKITESYRAARRKSDFDYETWVDTVKKGDLFSNDKATFVFGFLITEWKDSTHIIARKDNNYIIVEVVDRA